jgi:hypothetical protein
LMVPIGKDATMMVAEYWKSNIVCKEVMCFALTYLRHQ